MARGVNFRGICDFHLVVIHGCSRARDSHLARDVARITFGRFNRTGPES